MEPVQPSEPLPQLSPQQEAELARLQEVNRLITELFEREQVAIKAVMRCLYDAGTVNLVNQRVRIRPLRPLARPVLKLARPLFIPFGYRWVAKKCPGLISRWLQRKVIAVTSRRPPQSVTPPVPVTVTQVEPALEQPLLTYQTEIRRLRTQVRWTTVALAGVSATLALIVTKVEVKPLESLWQSSNAQPLLLIKDQEHTSSSQ